MNEKDIAMQIGNFFGTYFEEENQYCIDNGDQVFRYDSPKELLLDWLDTLVDHHLDTKGAQAGNWDKEIQFIYESLLKDSPTGVRPYVGKKATLWTASVDVSIHGETSSHGKTLSLGTYPTLMGALTARKEFKQFQKEHVGCSLQTFLDEASRMQLEATHLRKPNSVGQAVRSSPTLSL